MEMFAAYLQTQPLQTGQHNERLLFKKKYIFLDSSMETQVIILQKLCSNKKKKA